MIQIIIDAYPELNFRKITNSMAYTTKNDMYVQVSSNYTAIVNYQDKSGRVVSIFDHLESLYAFLDKQKKCSDNGYNLFTYSQKEA